MISTGSNHVIGLHLQACRHLFDKPGEIVIPGFHRCLLRHLFICMLQRLFNKVRITANSPLMEFGELSLPERSSKDLQP